MSISFFCYKIGTPTSSPQYICNVWVNLKLLLMLLKYNWLISLVSGWHEGITNRLVRPDLTARDGNIPALFGGNVSLYHALKLAILYLRCHNQTHIFYERATNLAWLYNNNLVFIIKSNILMWDFLVRYTHRPNWVFWCWRQDSQRQIIQYCGRWCPGSFRHQDNIGCMGPFP